MTDENESDADEQEQYGGTQDDDVDAVEQTERRTDEGSDADGAGDDPSADDAPDEDEWVESEHESPDDAEEG